MSDPNQIPQPAETPSLSINNLKVNTVMFGEQRVIYALMDIFPGLTATGAMNMSEDIDTIPESHIQIILDRAFGVTTQLEEINPQEKYAFLYQMFISESHGTDLDDLADKEKVLAESIGHLIHNYLRPFHNIVSTIKLQAGYDKKFLGQILKTSIDELPKNLKSLLRLINFGKTLHSGYPLENLDVFKSVIKDITYDETGIEPNVTPNMIDPKLAIDILELLLNAKKYGANTIILNVNAINENSALRIQVSDDGPGINPKNILNGKFFGGFISDKRFQIDWDSLFDPRASNGKISSSRFGIESIINHIKNGGSFEVTGRVEFIEARAMQKHGDANVRMVSATARLTKSKDGKNNRLDIISLQNNIANDAEQNVTGSVITIISPLRKEA